MSKLLNKTNKKSGAISIPLVIGLLLMALGISAAIKLSQQNQNTQNRAATKEKKYCRNLNETCSELIPCCSESTCQNGVCKSSTAEKTTNEGEISCDKITELHSKYCYENQPDTLPPQDSLSCNKLAKLKNKYCAD
ncbi:hypothetical protein KKA02_03605 [Patescibacteria group bacterium]|nr:hypothetical protein [Patescibacteria group bacterium]